MSIRLTQAEIQWIKQEYEAGNTVQDIVFGTGMSVSNVKRALAGIKPMKRMLCLNISNKTM